MAWGEAAPFSPGDKSPLWLPGSPGICSPQPEEQEAPYQVPCTALLAGGGFRARGLRKEAACGASRALECREVAFLKSALPLFLQHWGLSPSLARAQGVTVCELPRRAFQVAGLALGLQSASSFRPHKTSLGYSERSCLSARAGSCCSRCSMKCPSSDRPHRTS